MKNILPKVSFFIMSFNDARNMELAILSIEKQNYPKDKVEIIVIDDSSTDNSLDIAKKHKTKILINGRRDMYRSLSMGYHAASGKFCFQLDQDVELRHENFIMEMITPLIKEDSLSGSFTRYYPKKDQSWINRYISYDPAQQDPVYEYFSSPVENFIVKKVNNYFICDYSSKNIPAISLVFYRMEHLKKSPLWNDERFFDHETLMGVIGAGFTKFAYIPSAGLYHKHAKGLWNLIYKRLRNLKNHYLKTDSKYKYKWFDATSISGILKIIIWIIYANLFIPATIRGVMRSIKHRDVVFLTEPVVTITVTDAILFNFLTTKEGRAFIIRSLKTLIEKIF